MKRLYFLTLILIVALSFSCVFAFTSCANENPPETVTTEKDGSEHEGQSGENVTSDAEVTTVAPVILGVGEVGMNIGDSYTVRCDREDIEIRNSDPTVASVTVNGREINIIALGEGITDITVMSHEGAYSVCKVSVTGVTFEQKSDGTYMATGYNGSPINVYIPSNYLGSVISEIAEGAFSESDRLVKVTVGDNVTTIGKDAFAYCRNLYDVEIGKSVDSIGARAFIGTKWLDDQKDSLFVIVGDGYLLKANARASVIDIPEGVKYIGSYALSECYGVTQINMPKSLKAINEYAFLSSSDLEKVVFSGGIESVGYRAFFGCVSLLELNLPDSLKTISDEAFYDCTSLEKIYVGSGLEYIGANAFKKCISLTALNYKGSKEEWKAKVTMNEDQSSGSVAIKCSDGIFRDIIQKSKISSRLMWTVYSDGTLEITGSGDIPDYTKENAPWYGYAETIRSIEFADGVTGIGNYAFYGLKNVGTLIIPSNITRIGQAALQGCNSLKTLSLPVVGDGNKNTFIGYMFGASDYSGNQTSVPSTLKTLRIETVSQTTLSDYSFQYCKSVTDIYIGGKITNIGQYAFYHCEGLKNLEIGEGVRTIGYRAFRRCDAVASVTLPKSVKTINQDAFYVKTSGPWTVVYGGSKTDWGKISIATNNTVLANAAITYNSEK